ncbi:hypothetical protein LIER_22086 [Lithospermum erythrorhizon]|uniref:Uncharacterized protein n=1 Tax=Lithospermum erythrorhizon TaxID=34254 RepID=A0AAV3QWS0_LITER
MDHDPEPSALKSKENPSPTMNRRDAYIHDMGSSKCRVAHFRRDDGAKGSTFPPPCVNRRHVILDALKGRVAGPWQPLSAPLTTMLLPSLESSNKHQSKETTTTKKERGKHAQK